MCVTFCFCRETKKKEKLQYVLPKIARHISMTTNFHFYAIRNFCAMFAQFISGNLGRLACK